VPLGPFDRVPAMGLLRRRLQPFSLSPFHQGWKTQKQTNLIHSLLTFVCLYLKIKPFP
jgi:hypothetical protein